MATNKETATSRARLFPSTYKRFRVRAAIAGAGTTVAQVADDVEKKATLWEKSKKKQA